MPRRSARTKHPPAIAVGVDTGGTFTDVVVWRRGRREAFKVPSTPQAPERAVLEALARAGANARTRVRHGSTVATNALLERKGARVTLVTTAGFEDVLEIGRQDRPRLYDLAPRRPEPLVPRERRLGLRERLAAGGAPLAVPNAAELRRLAARVRASRPEAIAIGLLHSWANPAHERAVERALAGLGVPVTRSSALCPEIREYERFATTAANAYLAPRVSRYLGALARARRGTVEVVLSHGGTAPAAAAAREPARALLSGPAAGLRAALAAARACGHRAALTLDVGGTSTDCALLGAGDTGAEGLPRRRAREVGGVPVLLPALDVHTVGAGGGSIARVDAGGLLHVGPESAGADPGPACYGRGGPATVTDALVVLGLLPFATLAGGALALDPEAAFAALAKLGRALGGRDAAAAARGVLALANARMESALRAVSVERGEDPRAAALVAFGGAGGLHACALAEALGARAVVWPRHAGVLCALGALEGGARREASRSVLRDARELPALERTFAALEREVRRGLGMKVVVIERHAEARYAGQAHELAVLAEPLRSLATRFHAAHERRYGFADRTRAVEVVTLDVRAHVPAPAVRESPPRAKRGARPARGVVRVDGRPAYAAFHARGTLGAGATIHGPAIVLDEGATLWLPRAWRARVHASGAILATRSERGR
jgi:N-methylhydantoinase A